MESAEPVRTPPNERGFRVPAFIPSVSGPDGSSSQPAARKRAALIRPKAGKLPDLLFSGLMQACGFSLFAVVIFIVFELIHGSQLSIQQFGFKFFTSSAWDPVVGDFGALPFIFGTIVSSLLALVIAVPLAVGVAVFTTEMCPRFLRSPISYMVELLAAIPSVIYGLWAIFVLAPLMRDQVEPVLRSTSVGQAFSPVLCTDLAC